MVATTDEPLVTRLAHFSPMPPAQNGIADYAFRVAAALSQTYPSVIYTPTVGARRPRGVSMASIGQAPPTRRRGEVRLYQIGNNDQHVEVLHHALAVPGIVVLHDLQLLYLHQCANWSPEEIAREMAAGNPVFDERSTAALARHPGILPYLLFNMLSGVLGRAQRVVVHSQYAHHLIRRHFPQYADRVVVIPHFALSSTVGSRAECRRRIGVLDDSFLVVTGGHVTRSKQFSLIMRALAPLARTERRLRWIHAGGGDGEQSDLREQIHTFPELARVTRVTGRLGEDALDAHIAAADAFINLRHPSVGESSGSLARALAAGVCCIVSDTGAYAEIPQHAVLHVPVVGAEGFLKRALRRLIDDPEQGQRYGRNARAYAADDLSMDTYLHRLCGVIDQVARSRPLRMTRPASPKGDETAEVLRSPGFAETQFERLTSASDPMNPSLGLGDILSAGSGFRSTR